MTTQMFDQSKVEYYNKRLSALKTERTSFVNHWRELSQFLIPRRGRFITSDRNKGLKKNQSILDNTATRAVRTLSSGMMAGISSPARPWFRLSTPDPVLAKRKAVKFWLEDVERLLYEIFNRSNLYNVLPSVYAELGTFGTACVYVAKDFSDVVRFYPYSIGQYYIANNERLMVDTNYRELAMTVGQLVKKFGDKRVSQNVLGKYRKGQFDTWINVIHAVEPNEKFNPNRVFARSQKYRGVYFEKGNNEDKFLIETGYKEFPKLTPRWDVTGEDVYGTDCPGMIALGDTKQLQAEQRDKAKGIAKKWNPPLNAPPNMKKIGVNSLPGGVNYKESADDKGVTSVYDIRLELGDMLSDIRDVQERINSAFFVDLFQMIAQMQGVQPRNELEILERKEEKLIQLGPVLENLHNEMFDPC